MLVPVPASPAHGPPTDWAGLVQADDDRAIFQASPEELPVVASTVCDGIPCHGADGPRVEQVEGGLQPTRKIRPWAWIESSSAPPSEDRIESDQSRLLLLVILPARPTLAEVPLADLSPLTVPISVARSHGSTTASLTCSTKPTGPPTPAASQHGKKPPCPYNPPTY
jgi:hypothetical protein